MEEQSEEHHRCAQWSSIFNYIFRLIYDRYLYMYWKTLLGIAKEFASRNHQIRIHLFVNSARPTAEHIHISVKSIELYNKSKCVSKL